jgi:hypothetical protein
VKGDERVGDPIQIFWCHQQYLLVLRISVSTR